MRTIAKPILLGLFDRWRRTGVISRYVVVHDHMNGMADYRLYFNDGAELYIENGNSGEFTLDVSRCVGDDGPSEETVRETTEVSDTVSSEEHVNGPKKSRKIRRRRYVRGNLRRSEG